MYLCTYMVYRGCRSIFSRIPCKTKEVVFLSEEVRPLNLSIHLTISMWFPSYLAAFLSIIFYLCFLTYVCMWCMYMSTCLPVILSVHLTSFPPKTEDPSVNLSIKINQGRAGGEGGKVCPPPLYILFLSS